MDFNLNGKSVQVLGLGISGRSAARYLLAKGCKVWGADDNAETLEKDFSIQSLQNEGMQLSHVLEKVDLVIVSPGISPKHPLYQLAVKNGIPLLGEAELALSQISKKYKCIGITGTNGKTTVTYLLEHMLKVNGIKAKAVGNSGIPLTSCLLPSEMPLEDETIIVAELSSFQLETMQGRYFDSVVLLNITHDHLDRYASFKEYALAKIRIFDCLKEEGIGYIQSDCFNSFEGFLKNYSLKTYGFSPSNDIYFDGQKVFANKSSICFLPKTFQNSKNHDIENILAAISMALEMNADPTGMVEALQLFKKPPHRLEFVKEVNGIKFIDDSKATNTDAVIRAVQSITGPIILIAGGVHKGGSYRVWIPYFKDKILSICTIGQAAEKICKDLEEIVPIYHFNSLLEAVTFANKLARSGDTVLLSPGCSSYDMFSSYVHRGKHFKEIVHALEIKEEL